MSPFERITARQRAALQTAENHGRRQLIRAYVRVFERIARALADLTARITAHQDQGNQPTVSWLLSQNLYADLLESVQSQMATFADQATATITSLQARAVRQAPDDTWELIQRALGDPASTRRAVVDVEARMRRVPHEAFEELVGYSAAGRPLGNLLAEIAPRAREEARDALLFGVATGQHPRVMATQVKRATGIGLDRALTIARTETLRAYREATRRTYDQNQGVVTAWVWHAQLDKRTCAACWAMHGTVHGTGEPLGGHPNCRCAMIPETASWEALGIHGVEDTRPTVPSGEDEFARLPESEQRAILGPTKHRLYKQGLITLADCVTVARHPVWGATHRVATLSEALAARV